MSARIVTDVFAERVAADPSMSVAEMISLLFYALADAQRRIAALEDRLENPAGN